MDGFSRTTAMSICDGDWRIQCEHPRVERTFGRHSLLKGEGDAKRRVRGTEKAILYPSPGPSGHHLPSGEGFGRNFPFLFLYDFALSVANFKRTHSYWSSFSRASRQALVSSPPANPVNFPVEPMTRWHGAMMEMGFFPIAAPTARTALGFLICFAICP
jgi:hypothetical protein